MINVSIVLMLNYQKLLKYSEIFFKFAFAIHQPLHFKPMYLGQFSWGRHIAKEKELKLTKKEENLSVALLHHVATYILALQIDRGLQDNFPDRYNHTNSEIVSISWIVRLIRNAFSHNPFYPEWKFYSECKNKRYEVKDIIYLDTTNLDGVYVDRSHYGGPLALLRLSEHVRRLLKNSELSIS